MTRECISRISELREILQSFQTGFNLVNTAVACAIMVEVLLVMEIFLTEDS